MDAYVQHPQQFVYHSGNTMKSVCQVARNAPAEKKRVVFAEGEEEHVRRALQIPDRRERRQADPDRPPERDRESHARNRGAERVVCGGPLRRIDNCYSSEDHYASFKRIVE